MKIFSDNPYFWQSRNWISGVLLANKASKIEKCNSIFELFTFFSKAEK